MNFFAMVLLLVVGVLIRMTTELREEDMHYHGGLMDGDGSLKIVEHRKNDKIFGFSAYPSVEIAQQEVSFQWSEDDVFRDENYDLYYLAGLFDSDGWFVIEERMNGTFSFDCQILPKMGIQMSQEKCNNPTKEAVRELYDEYAPNCGFGAVEREKENHSDCWRISASGKPSLELMKALKPYLRLKKPKVEEILSVDWERVSSDKYEFMYAVLIHEKITEHNNTTRKRDSDFFR